MISIIAVGQKQPDWVNQAFLDYAGRLSGDQKILLKEVKAEPRTTGKTVTAMRSAEAQRIIAASDRIEILVALDERGKRFSTEEFADFIEGLRRESRDIAFLIGGPDGLDEQLKKKCQHLMSLSPMTLPHGLARVLLAEQLYRAWSLANPHPYHRA